MEDKLFAVSVVGYPGWFFFDFIQNVYWFMEMCGEDGKASWAFKRNELGQYERYACYVMDEDGGGYVIKRRSVKQDAVKPILEQDSMVCGVCGHEVIWQKMLGDGIWADEKLDYCPHCGRKVKWDD